MSETTTLAATDGTPLLLRAWDPQGAPRLACVLLHGLAEHSGRYEHVGAFLAGRGWLVRALDLRGFGGSGGRRARIGDFTTYLDDLEPLVRDLRDLGLPVVMLGQSMGGLLALRFAQDRSGIDLLVLAAPTIDANIPFGKRIAARVLRRILPGLAIPNGIDGSQLSRDPSVGEAYFADPLVHPRTTLAFGGAWLDAMARARAGDVPVPTLVLHGQADTLVPVEISAPLERFETVERIVFPDFRHEVYNEEGGAAALEAVVGWVHSRL